MYIPKPIKLRKLIIQNAGVVTHPWNVTLSTIIAIIMLAIIGNDIADTNVQNIITTTFSTLLNANSIC
jgi:hypothetical protein